MRAHAELMKRWLDDESMEIEEYHRGAWCSTNKPLWRENVEYREKPKEKKLVSKWLWAIQIGKQTLLSVYFCATKEELFKRYPHEIVVISRIEDSKIEVEE